MLYRSEKNASSVTLKPKIGRLVYSGYIRIWTDILYFQSKSSLNLTKTLFKFHQHRLIFACSSLMARYMDTETDIRKTSRNVRLIFLSIINTILRKLILWCFIFTYFKPFFYVSWSTFSVKNLLSGMLV